MGWFSKKKEEPNTDELSEALKNKLGELNECYEFDFNCLALYDKEVRVYRPFTIGVDEGSTDKTSQIMVNYRTSDLPSYVVKTIPLWAAESAYGDSFITKHRMNHFKLIKQYESFGCKLIKAIKSDE